MGDTIENEAYEEELLNYEEEDKKAPDSLNAKINKKSGKKDFLLKPELLRATVDSGFEHPSQGLEECDAHLVVHLHPSKANCASDAILSELSSMLFTYNETLGGVVLAYDPNIRSNLAKILPGVFPYFGVQLKAKLLLFNPKPDMVLEGEVVKLTPHSIHAVVLGFSSAVIANNDIRDEFKHKFKGGEGVYASRTHGKHKIKVGTILRFSVKSFDEEILHISGSLLAPHTGSARWLDKNLDEWSRADSTASKRKTGDGDLEKSRLTSGVTSLISDEQIEDLKRRRR